MPDTGHPNPNPSTLEKAVDNKLLTIAGRAMMVVSAPILVFVLGYVSGMARDISTVTTRVAVLESQTENIGDTLDRHETTLNGLDDRTLVILDELRDLAKEERQNFPDTPPE